MIIGLIGGVGSGKSAVTDVLAEKYGFRLLLTDDMAKETELPGGAGYLALTEAFGGQILENGPGSPIDKQKLASLIYSDPKALETVNGLIHPIVWGLVEKTLCEAKEADPDVRIAVETALPCERYCKMCDEIWFIYTDPEVRISRLQSSRGYSREKCISMIANQLTDEEFTAYADYIIDNSGSREDTAERIGELLCGL
ncbi:MAG: dephospho-CoA kinase [Lachnospiraceae bacterium]|nr:dephospho-CoA kinase [Lachnospiraceae bacterium]